MDAAGTLLAVADGQNHRVQLFESDGTVSNCGGGARGGCSFTPIHKKLIYIYIEQHNMRTSMYK